MGDPKRPRKKFVTPRYRWRKDLLETDLKIMGEFGLRNKRELWIHRTALSNYREKARSLLSKSEEDRIRPEKELLGGLSDIGIVPEQASLDNVLDLTLENILDRRLQTQVFKLGLAHSLGQSRQLINHGHINVGDKTVNSPSYLVSKEDEKMVAYNPISPLQKTDHPIHVEPTAAPKAIPQRFERERYRGRRR